MVNRRVNPKPRPRIAPKKSNQQSGGIQQHLQAYFISHLQILFSSLGRVIRTPLTSMMTISVLAIAIAFAAGFYMLIVNAQQLTGSFEDSNQISVFLKTKVTDTQGRKLFQRWQEEPLISSLQLITKDEALAEFQTYSGFGEALEALDYNPLPTVILVEPSDAVNNHQQIEALLERLQQTEEVDFAQLDMRWLQRLQSMMELAQRGVLLLSALLSLAVLFITGNTIRLELQSRQEEVIIAKLVGATHSFIQRPFLYCGFWYGFLAGFVAWLIVSLMMWILQKPIEKLSMLYDGSFHALFPSFLDLIYLLTISAILGIIGAWLVLQSQLQRLKPE